MIDLSFDLEKKWILKEPSGTIFFQTTSFKLMVLILCVTYKRISRIRENESI